jgi:hypothetical protein
MPLTAKEYFVSTTAMSEIEDALRGYWAAVKSSDLSQSSQATYRHGQQFRSMAEGRLHSWFSEGPLQDSGHQNNIERVKEVRYLAGLALYRLSLCRAPNKHSRKPLGDYFTSLCSGLVRSLGLLFSTFCF